MTLNMKKLAKAAIPIVLALISIFILSKPATSASFHKKTIETLDAKRTTVLELTAASTAASAAITLIPGDTATPIANKLADLSGHFLIVLCAIFLEKYLLTITGYAAFVILIPAACVLYSINLLFINGKALRQLAIRLIVFGLAIFCVVPASVKVSNIIEDTYGASIHETIEAAKDTPNENEGNSEDHTGEFFSSIISKVETGVSDITAKVQTVLNNFIEAFAVMLVTSCVIPIVVLLFFVWLIKVILGVNIIVPKFSGKIHTPTDTV